MTRRSGSGCDSLDDIDDDFHHIISASRRRNDSDGSGIEGDDGPARQLVTSLVLEGRPEGQASKIPRVPNVFLASTTEKINHPSGVLSQDAPRSSSRVGRGRGELLAPSLCVGRGRGELLAPSLQSAVGASAAAAAAPEDRRDADDDAVQSAEAIKEIWKRHNDWLHGIVGPEEAEPPNLNSEQAFPALGSGSSNNTKATLHPRVPWSTSKGKQKSQKSAKSSPTENDLNASREETKTPGNDASRGDASRDPQVTVESSASAGQTSSSGQGWSIVKPYCYSLQLDGLPADIGLQHLEDIFRVYGEMKLTELERGKDGPRSVRISYKNGDSRNWAVGCLQNNTDSILPMEVRGRYTVSIRAINMDETVDSGKGAKN